MTKNSNASSVRTCEQAINGSAKNVKTLYVFTAFKNKILFLIICGSVQTSTNSKCLTTITVAVYAKLIDIHKHSHAFVGQSAFTVLSTTLIAARSLPQSFQRCGHLCSKSKITESLSSFRQLSPKSMINFYIQFGTPKTKLKVF